MPVIETVSTQQVLDCIVAKRHSLVYEPDSVLARNNLRQCRDAENSVSLLRGTWRRTEWGFWYLHPTVLQESDTTQRRKTLILAPGKSTRMQLHNYRAEIILTGDSVLLEHDVVIHTQPSIWGPRFVPSCIDPHFAYIPLRAWHSLQNKTDAYIYLTEILLGAYDENDIERAAYGTQDEIDKYV